MSDQTSRDDSWTVLSLLSGDPAASAGLAAVVARLAQLDPVSPNARAEIMHLINGMMDCDLRASSLVLRDLWRQGWRLRLDGAAIQVGRPTAAGSLQAEKARVRAQLMVARDEQLASPAVREFVRALETRRVHRGDTVSIFSLMRDGEDLAGRLRGLSDVTDSGQRAARLAHVIDPYFEIVTAGACCDTTGLRLVDIWRYFRHTWSTPHRSVPGRTMMVLVRDAAAPHRPVIGIAALSSAAVQIRARDTWIGWEPDQAIENLRRHGTDADACWLEALTDAALADLYVADFIGDGTLTDEELRVPTADTLRRLRDLVRSARELHEDDEHAAREHKLDPAHAAVDWVKRARLPLFRSKRADVLGTVLRARRAMRLRAEGALTATSLQAMLASEEGRQATRGLLRRAKSERVGTAIADITVCGAVAPYSDLLGGKLVAMMLASEELRNAYRARYADLPSLIASSLAGRPVVRDSELVLLCTTSLYGVGSSQYSRLRMDAQLAGGSPGTRLVYEELGKTQGYGTGHLAEDTIEALEQVALAAKGRRRVRSIFGEGVSPRMRKAREGLEELGFAEAGSASVGERKRHLLEHGEPRIVYGLALAENFRDYLMGRTADAIYTLHGLPPRESTQRICDWWRRRWLSGRSARSDVLERVAQHRATYPVQHGARVPMLDPTSRQLTMFED